jgi:serine/threonine-protein kinase PpkA
MKVPGYKIQQQIGEGGMAKAFLATQESLGRLVVLKVMNTSHHRGKENVERFLNEGRIIASLNHPNVITIFDIGTASDWLYMSMEFIEGGDLRQRMRTPITHVEAVDIVMKVGSGLSVAHKKGIVHRDVKPGNILFRKDATPVLSDFGIAKQLTVDQELTATGIFLGSPNYMAPEQAEAGPIDGRADIYSLGIIFYEMLTGLKPYQSDSVVDIIVQHRQAPIPRLPAGLDQDQPLLNLMVAKKRKDRFRDVDSMLHYIQHMMQTGAIKSPGDMQRSPDIDISGSHEHTMDRVRKIKLPSTPAASHKTSYILASLLTVSLLGYAALFYAEYRMNRDSRVQESHTTLDRNGQPFDPKNLLKEVPDISSTGITTVPNGKNAQATTPEVKKALAWLAQKSLEDYRLTHPPKDNAYYYYSKLLEIDPANELARQGMLKIAERFAFLAERALATSDIDKARGYVKVGLQFDPKNKTLLTLRSLAQPRQKGWMETVMEFFRG